MINDQKGVRFMTCQPIEAIIFDLDGTIIDSEPVYFRTDQILLSEYGIHDFSLEEKRKYFGLSTLELISKWKELYPQITDSVRILTKKSNSIYEKLAKTETKCFPKMKDLILALYKLDYPMAVASGSSRSTIGNTLKMVDLLSYFQHYVSSEEVPHGKPAPDVFVEAANRLGVQPQNCLVLEDSLFGVIAAKKANMYCIATPVPQEELPSAFHQADLLFPGGMDQFSVNKVLEWIQSRS